MQNNRLFSLQKLKKELLFMGLEPEQYRQVKAPVAEDNRRSVAAWSVCTGLFWIMSLILSLNRDAYAACRVVYAAALGFSVLTLFCAHFLVRRFPGLIHAIVPIFELSVAGAGVGIAILQPTARTVTMIAFAIILPVCVIDRTVSDAALQAVTAVAYVILGKSRVEPDVFFWQLTNFIIFAAAGLLVGHVINKSRFRRYVYEEAAKKLAEIQSRYAHYDELTGLKNRRAFEEALEILRQDPPDVFSIVMADLNGLKQANDTYGHEAGDELIIGASTCLKEAFGEAGTVFRIGGDEFCVIMTVPIEEAEHCVEVLERITAEWKGKTFSGLSISCGAASGRDPNGLKAVIAQADKTMYENKQKHYLNDGSGGA